MAGVVTYTAGSLFTVTTQKRWANTPAVKWENVYTAVATDDGGLAALGVFCNILVGFERGLHTDGVEFTGAEVRTWFPDSSPYDPSAFAVIPASGLGLNGDGDNTQPLDVCLMLHRSLTSGRQGTLAYRSCLTTGSVDVVEGQRSLADPSGIQTGIDGLITSSGLFGYIEGGTAPLKLCLITNGTPIITRVYQDILVSGVSIVKMKHKWFNRT